jgi:trimethylamine corrinoid protein
MEKTQWFQKAVQSVLDTDEEAAKKVSIESLEAGMDPLEMINQGFTEGIRKIGDLFERGEVFLPGLIVASEAMTAAVEILEAALPAEKQERKKAVIVLGIIEGDIHDIGKGIIGPFAVAAALLDMVPLLKASDHIVFSNHFHLKWYSLRTWQDIRFAP